MRASKRATTVLLAGVLAVVGTGCGDDDDDASPATGGTTTTASAVEPAIKFASPPPQSVQGNVVPLNLDVQGISLVRADGDTSGTTGHLHVYIDKEPVPPGAVVPKEAGVIHTAENPVVLRGLSVGEHQVVVIVGDGTHRRLGVAQVLARFKVDGPSVRASVTGGAGEATVSVQVEGISLVKADGDTSGDTGHVHLFVDRPPTPAGQPIPVEPGIIHTADTNVSLPSLTPGEHTVTVVIGDGVHMPLQPPVEDKVTFTVQ